MSKAEHFLSQQRAQEAVTRYVEGYRQHPETDEEIAAVEAAIRFALALE